MRKKLKMIVISMICVAIAVTGVVFAALYVNARIVFSGITLLQNGDTTQCFVDVRLKNINTTGVSFCLKYNTDYLTLSEVETNEKIFPAVSESGYNLEHKYFRQNYDLFPEDCFVNVPPEASEIIGKDLPVMGSADVENGFIAMNFVPMESAIEEGTAIGWGEDGSAVIEANTEEGVLIGSLSFAVNDPSAVAKLSDEELTGLIQIVPFKSMGIVSDDEDTGVNIVYLKEDQTFGWYTRSEKYIDYEIDLKVELRSVTPDVSEASVSSYDIYRNGTIDDLIHYLNRNMNSLTLEYTDNKKVTDTFVWDASATGFFCDYEWDPKGNITYTVSQAYNEKETITVSVSVTPVKIKGYYADKQYLSYVIGADSFPETLEDLKLPEQVKPILEPAVYGKGVSEVPVSWYEYKLESGTQLEALPDAFVNNIVSGEHIFVGIPAYGSIEWEAMAPWLTYEDVFFEATRYIIDAEENGAKDVEVVSGIIDENGIMHITVRYADLTPMTMDTEFKIRLPNGEILDTIAVLTNISINDAGEAQIEISPDINGNEYQVQIAKCFNMGSRLGDYAINAKELTTSYGEFTEFTPTNRPNNYIGGNYTFNYSDDNSEMISINAGSLPSTTITLPGTDIVSTTYSGYGGYAPGELKTVSVDGWELQSGDLSLDGDTITVVGTLSETQYTNYGFVNNPNSLTVTLIYTNKAVADMDSIEPINDFVFNKQCVGYDYDKLQTKTFTVINNGLTEIQGLFINITYDESEIESFVLSDKATGVLNVNESTTFDITTKHGLSSGMHAADVTITSNRGILNSFRVTFEVTEEPVYSIIITSSDENFGTAKTVTEAYTAQAGEAIEIEAIPEEDCEFVEWVSNTDAIIDFDNVSSAKTSFIMPDSDVFITAEFKETPAAYLRLTSLDVVSSLDYSTHTLYNNDWNPIEFASLTREYYVCVPNAEENQQLWFNVREEGKDADITVTHTRGGASEEVTYSVAEDGIYKTDDFYLNVSPEDNILTIEFEYDDEGSIITKSYVLHIYRKIAQKNLMVSQYGNSPYGLIMRDSAILDENKAKAKELFKNNKYRFDSGYVPAKGNENVRYRPDAWTGLNYDTDDYAIFVINDAGFVDPGWKSFTNSIGTPLNPSDVSRSITINVLEEQNPDYQNGMESDLTDVISQTILISSSSSEACEVTELKDLRIRPDIYELKYTFKDFDGTDVNIVKPVILLSGLGDLTVNKMADEKDAYNIMHRFENAIPDMSTTGYTVGGRLYQYRVCDTNKDGNINAIDANVILANNIIPFYSNIEGGTN